MYADSSRAFPQLDKFPQPYSFQPLNKQPPNRTFHVSRYRCMFHFHYPLNVRTGKCSIGGNSPIGGSVLLYHARFVYIRGFQINHKSCRCVSSMDQINQNTKTIMLMCVFSVGFYNCLNYEITCITKYL